MLFAISITLLGLCVAVPICIFLVLIYSGASFSIPIILCFVMFLVAPESPFFKNKKVSKSTLFLSEEGNASQILPSSALYQRSIAKL